jgi:hypothetical protein
MGPPFGSGGSFLGTAASTAAGVIGGGLLLIAATARPSSTVTSIAQVRSE